ncbi:MAG: hypothetical protein ACYCOU_18815, partial [Sulfobacillus sp.]
MTAYVVVKDAERTIWNVLAALRDIPGVQVWDLGSQDRTTEIAQLFDRVVYRWEGPVPPIVEAIRVRLLDRCQTEYVLFVDQDEVHVNTVDSIVRHIAASKRQPLAFEFWTYAMRRPVGREGTHCRLFRVDAAELANSIHQGNRWEGQAELATGGYVEHH